MKSTIVMNAISNLLAGVLLAALCVAALPSAASAQKRVTVSQVKGRGGALVRGGVVRALKEESDVEVVGSGDEGVAVVIEGEVERAGRRVAATISVVNASNGETLGVVSYEAKNPKLLGRAVERKLWDDISDLIAQVRAPEGAAEEPEAAFEEPEPEPEPIAETESEDDEDAEDEDEDEPAQESEDDGPGGDGPSPFDVGVSLAGFSRSFDYNDDLSGLRTYDLGLGPSLMLKLHWYPAAHFDDGFVANIGLELRGQFAFGIDSALSDVSFPTSASALGAGLRARFPIDDHELAAVVGYANQSYAIDSAEDAGVEVEPGIPSTSYSYLRLGAELRFALGDAFALGAAAAYLPVFSTGDIGAREWFPRASATGMEGELSLTHMMSKSFELNAAFGLQRFAFSFDARVEDVAAGRRIAGGAVDQYLWGTLGVRWLLGS